MSDQFDAAMNAFKAKVEQFRKDLLTNVASAAKSSITDGSPVTGAPGQPVDTGQLKGSWQVVFESANTALVGTNIAYAPVAETGMRSAYDERGDPGEDRPGPHRKSVVGGPHSVALTRQNFDRLVESEARKLARA